MDTFKNRVVVITGGAGGIGLSMARAFADEGAAIVLADLNEKALQEATREIETRGARVLGVPTDVTRLESVQQLASATREHFGAVHIVCNNAGIALFGEIAQATHRDWEFTMNVDFWGVVHGIETFVPLLLEQNDEAHIVNTASMAGLVGMRWLGIYSAAKFAVVGLSEALHRELKPQGIGVSVLCPMIVSTNINENSVRMRPKEMSNPQEAPLPDSSAMAGGVIAPEEVARRVLRGIKRRDLYILTHPEQREFLRRRAAKLDSMFEEDVW